MTVIITFTTVGTDAGPFNLYSNVDGYASAFAVGITAAQLLAGYPSDVVPDGTTIIRAKSFGICTNFVDLPVVPAPTTTTTSSSSSSTTTTTSSSSTTTTTTTLAPSFYAYMTSDPGRASSGLACSQITFPNTFYAAQPSELLGIGTQMYLDSSLSTPVGPGNLWYLFVDSGIAYRIDDAGQIAESVTC
jgi:hypothetical protein